MSTEGIRWHVDENRFGGLLLIKENTAFVYGNQTDAYLDHCDRPLNKEYV